MISWESIKPTVWARIDHFPLLRGQTQKFYCSTDFPGLVQYRLWIKDPTGTWLDLTGGYTVAVPGTELYVIEPSYTFDILGIVSFSLWCKRDGRDGMYTASNGETYDSIHAFNLECLIPDPDTNLKTDGEMVLDKSVFTVGEPIYIYGVAGLTGMQSPYKINLHVYQSKDYTWISNLKEYDETPIMWVPQEPGDYILDIWIMPVDGKRSYEGWKLKKITVLPKP